MSYLGKYDKYKTRYSALLQFAGEILLDISYNGMPVQSTMELSQVQNAPTVKILDEGLHTLLLVDPDASAGTSGSSNTILSTASRTWLHWMIVNNKDQVMSYYPPTPPAGSGPHRYTFILYKQQGPIKIDAVERGNFDAHSFAEKYNLQKIAKKVFVSEKI